MQTDMHTVKLIVQDAVRRERRIMVTMMMVVTGVALIMSQSQTVRPVALNQSPISSFTLPPSSSSSSYSSSSSSSSYLTSSVLRTRRILQQLDPALVERAVNELKMLVQVLEKDMGGTIAATIDAPQGEPAMESIQPLMGHSSLQVPAPAPAPAPEPTALASEACTCPPGPRGPPGEPAPSFLSDVFSYDPASGTLLISATTLNVSGSLVVFGYGGFKRPVFIGGDAATGTASTEIGPGQLSLYSDSSYGPIIGGYTTGSATGYQLSKLTVQGQLYEDINGNGQVQKVSTRLF